MDMTLKLQLKNVYGHDLYYPKNKAAEVLVGLLQRKAFRKEHVDKLKSIGFKIEWVSL